MNATNTQYDIVIIGTGIAGTALVREVRKHNPNISIAMITADSGQIYAKPMLSNALAQNKTPDALVQKTAEAYGAEMNVCVHSETRVDNIERDAKAVHVHGPEGHSVIGYDKLILAQGAHAREYSIEGAAVAPLFSVNSLDDYSAWRAALSPDARVLLIGAGLIGTEFANDLVGAGYDVSMVDMSPWPLGRLLPESLGREMQRALNSAGVRCHMNRMVRRMVMADPVGDASWSAHLDDGSKISFDIALTAIGVVPNTALAKTAKLAVDQGIRVNDMLATSDENIYALGDCAETQAGVLPYIQPIMIQARALARTLTGRPQPLELPAMAVTVKTPSLPCVVCPPPPAAKGEWVVKGEGADRHAVFATADGAPLGFALSGTRTKARQALIKEMPAMTLPT